MLIGAGQEAPAPAPATPQQRVAAPWPHGGGEDVGGGMLGAVFPFWPLQGGDLEGQRKLGVLRSTTLQSQTRLSN